MFQMRFLARAAAVSCTILSLTAAAQAATYDVMQQHSKSTHDGVSDTSISGLVNRPMNGRQSAVILDAGSHHLKMRTAGTTDAWRDFIAFSVEVTEPIATGAVTPTVFTRNDTPFDAQRRGLMATLIGHAFDPTKGASHHAAVQLALWKIAYGDISSPFADGFTTKRSSSATLSSGFMSLPRSWNGVVPAGSFLEHDGLLDEAESYLKRLDGRGGDDWSLLSARGLTLLSANGSQDLVTYAPAPVPLPAGIVLLASGLGALLLRRRKSGA